MKNQATMETGPQTEPSTGNAPQQQEEEDLEWLDISTDSAASKGGGANAARGASNRPVYTRNDPGTKTLRILAFIVLLAAGVIVSFIIYKNAKDAETSEFEQRYKDQSAHVKHALHSEITNKLSTIEAFSITVQSHAKSSGSIWPMIVLPEFAYHATSTLTNARGTSITLVPVVEEQEKESWENYSITEEGWRQDGLQFQERFPDVLGGGGGGDSHTHMGHRLLQQQQHNMSSGMQDDHHLDSMGEMAHPLLLPNISQTIFNIQDGAPVQSSGSGPFFPVWQGAPVHHEFPWENYDLGSNDIDAEPIKAVLESGKAVIGNFFDMAHWHSFPEINEHYLEDNHDAPDVVGDDMDHSDMNHATDAGHEASILGPASIIWYPIFDDFDGDRKIVAVLGTTVQWDSFFLPSLPPNPDGIICVISNPCGQAFTFKIEGSAVLYMGPEDYHESEYDEFVVSKEITAMGSSFTRIPLDTEYCQWRVDVYPSTQMESAFRGNSPALYATYVAAIFSFTMLVFGAYVFMAEERQKYLADTANKTNEIVSSLFPEAVRGRLFDNSEAEIENRNKSKRLFLTDDATRLDQRKELAEKTAPIADHFPEVTIMFGDIAGFTAWSSNRDPCEVFTLLETLYGAFDAMAKKRQVFKVETIGDCYLAVTGIPDRLADHAVRMAQFASSCLNKVNKLTRELGKTMGPETADLSFRIGLHSGAVTAGVLRGEKSRFQLFGDTVNTTARIETTGMKGRVHLSEQTAQLLFEAGKSQWVEKREELVAAKGKGRLQTYWLRSHVELLTAREVSSQT